MMLLEPEADTVRRTSQKRARTGAHGRKKAPIRGRAGARGAGGKKGVHRYGHDGATQAPVRGTPWEAPGRERKRRAGAPSSS